MKKLLRKDTINELSKLLETLGAATCTEQLPTTIRMYELLSSQLQEYFKTSSDVIRYYLQEEKQPEAYLAKLLNSRSRASEILNDKRLPTLSDIKILTQHLGIPAALLLLEGKPLPSESVDFKRVVAEMKKRGWVSSSKSTTPQEVMETLCQEAGYSLEASQAACFRQLPRKNAKTDTVALQAWLLKARIEARKVTNIAEYSPEKINQPFITQIVQDLSTNPHGASSVQKYLASYGICFIVLPHLKGTHLDGAVFFLETGVPVIVATIRYDRTDNFWYVLSHELAHLALNHLAEETTIFDDLDLSAIGEKEIEADSFAREALIPRNYWDAFSKEYCRANDIFNLAFTLRINPAIVAGRIRFENRDYRQFTALVGHGEVRREFPEVFKNATA